MSLVCDLPLYDGTVDGLAQRIVEDSQHRALTVFTVNVDFLALATQSAEFRRALSEAEVLTPDGVPILWLRRLYGRPLKSRISGADLVLSVVEKLAQHGGGLFILGATAESRERAEAMLRRKFSGLQVSGMSPSRAVLYSSSAEICHAISRAEPSVLLVALGAPVQELWIQHYKDTLAPMAMIGVGASIDFISGVQRRAPMVFRKSGFEWLWRMLCNPRRLYQRYLLRDAPFFVGQLAVAIWAARYGRRTT